MLQWWERFSKRPFVAHLLRAVERFNIRGGIQLAAAITYFSVLSLVPILMLAFSALGLTLTVFRPELLGQIEGWLRGQLDADSDLGKNVYTIINGALTNWASIALPGLAIMIWVGSGWVGNLKRAVRLLMREDVDKPGKQLPMPLDILANFAGLLGILVGVAATFAASGVSTWLAGSVGQWLGFQELPGWSWVLRVLGLLVSFAVGVVLFRLLFGWFSPGPVPSHLAWVGAAIGSLGLIVLQSLTGYLIGAFSRNLGFAVFGSTLVLMLFLNLFATLMLYIAAWLATNDAPAPEPTPLPEIEAEQPVEARPGELSVSSEVARRSLGIGLGTGYVVGAATGLGVGAVLTSILARLFGRRE
ncbi:YhjD/YihY/BrkB family envelope integrity protein [Propionicimonas sp.]|uniref:YhjD/YihY/BrkB family envelope integrity protein n=1 Tax=Propionicimonas sp. TaxID=1955623 RepID=UPI0039E3AAE0